MNRNWFEMSAIRRRNLENSVWIPLRQSETRKSGDPGTEGFGEEFSGAGCLLVPLSSLEAGEELAWMHIGISRDHGPVIYDEHYIPTGIYQFGTDNCRGEELVVEQTFSGDLPPIWHLNQDIIFALRLLREGDDWVRPNEMYSVVARLRRDDNGKPLVLEMKSEFLKDYLKARNMALRVSRFISRTAIVADISQMDWTQEIHSEHSEHKRFDFSATTIHEGGHVFGSEVAVFHLARTDVDLDDDVPTMVPVDEGSIEHASWTKKFSGRPLHRLASEYWTNEWVQPAEYSPRVSWDHMPSSCVFIVSASGEKMNIDKLNDEDTKRWLWFRSGVVEALLECRGSYLEWHTRDTGGIRPGPDGLVRFGINELQLVNVYVADIAKIPEWQKRLWAGYKHYARRRSVERTTCITGPSRSSGLAGARTVL